MLQNVSEMYTSINLGENASRFCNGRMPVGGARPRNGKTSVATANDVRLKLSADADPYAFAEPESAARSAGVPFARKPPNGAAAAAVAAATARDGVATEAPERKRKRPSTDAGPSQGTQLSKQRSLLEEQLLGIKAEPTPPPPQSRAATSARPGPREAAVPQRDRRHDEPAHEALQRICVARDLANDFHQHLYPLGVEASESESSDGEDGVAGAFQRHWFSAAHGQGEGLRRDLRIDLVRCEMRHRVQQVTGGICGTADETRERLTRAIVATARTHPSHVAAFLAGHSRTGRTHRAKRNRSKSTALAACACEAESCEARALPCTRHCLRHVVANADQLLFEHCTAKFSDNTQCAEPVFDICHELPLCAEHARKRDNYDRMCAEVKPKKTRKKAKASAMTRRAAKRGRSKRKRRSPQKLPSALKLEPIGNQSLGSQPMGAQVAGQHPINSQSLGQHPIGGQAAGLHPMGTQLGQQHPIKEEMKTEVKLEPVKLEALEQVEIEPVGDYEHQQFCVDEMMYEMDTNLDMYIKEEVVESFDHPDMHAMLKQQQPHAGAGVAEALSLAGLPLDPMELANQAARLLEEHDLNNVLNQIPADAFNDLFTEDKNGAYEPTREETEELERALEAVDKDVKSLEKLSQTQGLLETLMDDPALATLATLHEATAPSHGAVSSAVGSFAPFHHNGYVTAGNGAGPRKCADAANISIHTQTHAPS